MVKHDFWSVKEYLKKVCEKKKEKKNACKKK